jgi:hypothetical protein
MRYKGSADAVGMSLSILCVLHCIVLPVFLTTFPFLGMEIIENKYLESVMILLSTFIGGYAIKKGFYRFHKNRWIVAAFLTGLVLLTIGNFLPLAGEIALKLSGAIMVLSSHMWNYKHSKTSQPQFKPDIVLVPENNHLQHCIH